MKPIDFKIFFQNSLMMALMAYASQGLAANTWSYLQDTDRLTNLGYSYALSPMPRRDLYDDLKLEVVCLNKVLQVNVNAENLITSQNKTFELAYQIDREPPVPLQMKTFPDSKRKAYVDGPMALAMIDRLLAGKETVFLRITTITKKVLSGAISLKEAGQPIRQVLADCGVGVGDNSAVAADAYDWASFEQDFKKLSADQQKQLLKQIQTWLTGQQ